MTESENKIRRCTVCGLEFPSTFTGDRCTADGGILGLADSDRMIGSLIDDKYLIKSRVGSGGWSTVYLADDHKLKRQVAIKLMHAFLQAGTEPMKRFRRESELTARLQHPNLAVVYDCGALSNGQPYIAMELLKGNTLDEILQQEKRLSVRRMVAITSQVCDALHYAHRVGIVHRDLTPSNIFILDGDVVKVIDFGLAYAVDLSHSLTAAGGAIGTPQFMSPEQCRGQTIDARSDIYSLGLIMYATLSGVKPIDGQNVFEIFAKQSNDTPKSLPELCPDLYFPPGITQAIDSCLSKNPLQRFSDCLELKQALLSGLEGGVSLPAGAAKDKSARKVGKGLRPGGLMISFIGCAIVAAALAMYYQQPRVGDNKSSVVAVKPTVPSSSVLTKTAVLATTPSAPVPTHPINVPSTVSLNVAQGMPVRLPSGTKSKPPTFPPITVSQKKEPKTLLLVESKPQPPTIVAASPRPVRAPQNLKTLMALGQPPAPTTNDQRLKQLRANADAARHERQVLDRVKESGQRADQAYDSQNYGVALMLYRQIERDLGGSRFGENPTLIPYEARVIACLWNLHQDDQMQADLNMALVIFVRQPVETINVVRRRAHPSDTWTELGMASLVVAQGKGLSASKADYLDWSRIFFDLAREQWNRPKDDVYRAMIGQYCTVLRLLGNGDEANALQRSEHPIYPTAVQTPAPGHPNPPKQGNQKPKQRGSRYIRNYHF